LPVETILNYCQVNQYIKQVCQHRYLWAQLIRRDFPHVDLSPNTELSLKDRYINLYQTHTITIQYNHYNFVLKYMSPQKRLEYPNELAEGDYVAIYQDENNQYIGFRTRMGVDPSLTNPENIDKITVVDFTYPNMSPELQIILQLSLQGMNDAISNTIQRVPINMIGMQNIQRDVDLLAKDILRKVG
jgi:hypothetical protein